MVDPIPTFFIQYCSSIAISFSYAILVATQHMRTVQWGGGVKVQTWVARAVTMLIGFFLT